MNRNILIVIVVVGFLLVVSLSGYVIHQVVTRPVSAAGMSLAEVEKPSFILTDKYAGREDKAIEIVKQFKVLSPDYVAGVMGAKEKGKTFDGEKTYVTIEELVEQKFLEKSFNMPYLQKGEWRALHLDTDTADTQIPDPQYEVYLDYKDEAVEIGPVWIVDVESGDVIPRNDMAAVFDQNTYNYNKIKESIERPGSVIRAIVSHKFDNQIDLGGVLLLHFLKNTRQAGHENDRIIGWTIMQEFEFDNVNDFSAYFQWVEKDETKVAKFKFNWQTKKLTPRGFEAIELMNIGDKMETMRAADIYPSTYTNNLNIPRKERWRKDADCRTTTDSEVKQLCTAFVRVLEQQEFINAMQWLLTNGKKDGSRAIDDCKKASKCKWRPRKLDKSEIPPEFAENASDSLYEISYIYYEMNGRDEQQVRFIVDAEKETITPIDKLSKWAYYSVAPHT